MTRGTLLLISGLPRSGKTTLADALTALAGATHVPLDRYIRHTPTGSTFLEWLASPACIDWALVGTHLDALDAGQTITAPSDWGPTWGDGGQQVRAAGSGRTRVMQPSDLGYAIPGCHAFELSRPGARCLRVFVETPRSVIAERAIGRAVNSEDVDRVLDAQLSANWRSIEHDARRADVVVSGVASDDAQVRTILARLSR